MERFTVSRWPMLVYGVSYKSVGGGGGGGGPSRHYSFRASTLQPGSRPAGLIQIKLLTTTPQLPSHTLALVVQTFL